MLSAVSNILSAPGAWSLAGILALSLLAFIWRVGPKLADRWPEIVRAYNERMIVRHAAQAPTVIDLKPEPKPEPKAIEGEAGPR